jgi:hypothetical protein
MRGRHVDACGDLSKQVDLNMGQWAVLARTQPFEHHRANRDPS